MKIRRSELKKMIREAIVPLDPDVNDPEASRPEAVSKISSERRKKDVMSKFNDIAFDWVSEQIVPLTRKVLDSSSSTSVYQRSLDSSGFSEVDVDDFFSDPENADLVEELEYDFAMGLHNFVEEHMHSVMKLIVDKLV